jgi:hypothetical protein
VGGSVAGAVVFIESGLDGFAFDGAPPVTSLSVRAGAIEPALSVAELRGEVRVQSVDGKLHTLVASQGDADLFNLPLQSSGASATAEVRRGQGIASLRCTVHERAEHGQLVVVAHPFHAVLDASGRFAWTGVPAEHVTIAVVHQDGRMTRAEAAVTREAAAAVALQLPAPGGR